MPSQDKTIVVFGAGGGQGRGVVSALLKDDSTRWLVRAVVRDANSERSKQFLADYQTADNRLSIAAGTPYDPTFIREVLVGAYGVFGVTFEALPGKLAMHEEDTFHELEAGRNIVDALEPCGVNHFIWSSLPDMISATSGRYPKIHHMNTKYITEIYARKNFKNSTFLIPGFFYSNLHWAWYANRRADGVVKFCGPIPGPKHTQWTDSHYDIGVFAARVFSLGTETTKGKTYPCVGPSITMDEMAATFTKITGQPAVHDPLTPDQWADFGAAKVGPGYRDDMRDMMQWVSEAPDDKILYGSTDPEADRSFEEVGVRASSFEEWLKRTGWAGPVDLI